MPTEMTYEEHFYNLFNLTCEKFLVKKEHIDEMRQNPKIVELVLLSFFEAYEKSKNHWIADFGTKLLKDSVATRQFPMAMEIYCNFSEALIRIYEKTENEPNKEEAKQLHQISMQKRDEFDPIVTFQNKPIRYSKISKHDHQSWDYEKLRRAFEAFNDLVRNDRFRQAEERMAEKRKKRNRKNREKKKNKKIMAKEGVQDTTTNSKTRGSAENKIEKEEDSEVETDNSTDNSEIPESSLQDTPTSSKSPGSSESKISEMVKKLMDFEI